MNFEAFNSTVDGKKTRLYQLKNQSLNVYITNYGGRIVALYAPDRNGKMVDVVLGFDSLEKYIKADEQYHGAIIGRVGNRIGHGQFSLEGKQYTTAVNCGDHSLHGGIKGFQSVVWDVLSASETSLTLSYHSRDTEEGFPGNMTIQARYELKNNELHITFVATTDKTTIVNMTHHNYFNLMGEGAGLIEDQELQLFAQQYTPLEDSGIPTGEIASVYNTPFDFTDRKKLGKDINDAHHQTQQFKGYDHNFVVDGYVEGSRTPRKAAIAWAPNGIKMTILSNEPGIQLYTGNSLSGKDIGKSGTSYASRNAFCLEQQHYPDSINQPSFPSIVLHPGEEYYSICIQKFEVE
ncbi:MAG: galactose mutarotase [Saprospiraceae bacterium]|nr:galactose mutarotase [Saprospiraceae bacterium]